MVYARSRGVISSPSLFPLVLSPMRQIGQSHRVRHLPLRVRNRRSSSIPDYNAAHLAALLLRLLCVSFISRPPCYSSFTFYGWRAVPSESGSRRRERQEGCGLFAPRPDKIRRHGGRLRRSRSRCGIPSRPPEGKGGCAADPWGKPQAPDGCGTPQGEREEAAGLMGGRRRDGPVCAA